MSPSLRTFLEGLAALEVFGTLAGAAGAAVAWAVAKWRARRRRAPAAPVEWCGWQCDEEGRRGFRLYSLTADIPGHPRGSTVSERTLRRAGYRLPEAGEHFSPEKP